MNDTPDISVVIPAWRAAATIGRAINSVLSQTRAAGEIIVVDDGSPEDIRAALAGFPAIVRVVRQDNAGASAARNRGIDEARGSWIAFLDADDEWLPSRLAQQWDALVANPTVGMIWSGYWTDDTASGEVGRRGPPPEACGQPLVPSARGAMDLALDCWTSTVLVARIALGADRFRTDLKTAEDRELWIRLLRRTTGFAIAEPLAIQHATPGSLSRSDIVNDCRNMLQVVQENAELLSREEVRGWEIRSYRRLAGVLLAEGRPREAIAPALARLRRDPWALEGWWTLVLAVGRGLVP